MTELPPVILIATRNPGKLREIREIMSGWPLQWEGLDSFPEVPEPEETGDTFAANARQKALYYAARTNRWALADDSGLEVDALGGAPGIYSARYAGAQQDDRANNARLIRELADVPPERRSARFRCAVALVSPAPPTVVAEADGTVEGVIIDGRRGENGFGYDPHFMLPELGKTSAELSSPDKARISHRGRALRALAAKLERLWGLPDAI
jgi:XTP/dITP diphosphohydrolase